MQQIQASHEGVIGDRDNNQNNQEEECDILSNYHPIECLAIKVKSISSRFGLNQNHSVTEKQERYSNGSGVGIDNDNINASSDEMCFEPSQGRTGIWGKIRSTFAKYLGDEGAAIDAAWTSKLEA